jgi:signal transduction histidine kinase
MHDLEKTLRLGLERRRLTKENLELSHLTRKLIELDQVKSDIISTVSHEFRTPLTAIKGYMNMLEASGGEKGDPEMRSTWLGAINDNVSRLEMLILNLLLMTEANTGEMFIADEEVRVSALVEDALKRLDALSRSKEVNIDIRSTEEGMVRGDQEKLGVALTNIIENAIKFNLDSGVVEIGLCRTEDPEGVSVSVLDNGIGIPEEMLPQIFGSFTQADMTPTRRYAGAGLGLPVAKAIVEAHGGRIDVDSQPGRGSTFNVWLPRRNGG